MTASLHAGPEVLFARGRAALLAVADRRWYAGPPSSHGLGLRLEGRLRLAGRLWLGAGAGGTERRHRNGPASDGPRFDLDLDLAWAATPAITLGLRGGWQRTRAERPSLRARTAKLGASAGADLPPVLGVAGFVAGLSHDVLFTDYDEPGYTLIDPDARPRPAVGLAAHPLQRQAGAVFGFAPALSLVHERRSSNIAGLFDYRRNHAELSLRRAF